MHLRRLPFVIAALIASHGSSDPPAGPPRLLLLLTIDQGRGDYLERFRPALEGGLGRLADESVVFTDAHHFHAHTVTAPGHASLSTGRYPSRSGIVGNNFFDRTEARWVYCVEDAESPVLAPEGASVGTSGRSPSRLVGNGLADWIQTASAESKVFSVGAKDRGAILMGGKHAHAAYWFDVQSGQWVTSSHYAQSYPEWVQAFHRRRGIDAWLGTTWAPLPVTDELLSRMEIEAEGNAFAHALGGVSDDPDRAFYDAIYNSPFIESSMLDFAEVLVIEEGLGQDENVDVLGLSFASVDTVGHEYGPNSRELLDTIMRLDRELGELFAFLDERIGLENVAVALSADHGVAPLPEYRIARGLPGGRLSSEERACLQRTLQAFDQHFGHDDWFLRPWHFDYETLERRGLERETAETWLATELERCPRIDRVVSRSEIEAGVAASSADPTLELYVHSFHPDRSPDLYLQAQEFYINRDHGSTHGSPHAYDTHVLALVRWPGLEPKSVDERIHTVDLPVTLTSLLGIEAPDDVDGVDRSDLIR